MDDKYLHHCAQGIEKGQKACAVCCICKLVLIDARSYSFPKLDITCVISAQAINTKNLSICK